MIHDIPEEIRYRLLRYLEGHPEATQRELARYLDISIGKVNYCLRALIEKGWLKVLNFRNAKNKLSYAEIERLTREVAEFGGNADPTTNI